MGYYVVSDDKCFYEGMTKEQILAAITQAIETHEIHDVDTGFVTTLKEGNKNSALSFWVGTTAEYNAIDPKVENCLYILTDDTELEDLEEQIARTGNILKGEVVFDGYLPSPHDQSSTTHPVLTGDHDIWDFSLVTVIDADGNEVLCQVTPTKNLGEFNGAIIEGCAPDFYSARDNNQAVVLRSIMIQAMKYPDEVKIIYNYSTKTVVYDPTSSLPASDAIVITKIIGVM